MPTGIPIFYLELAIGQRMRKASISCWNLISPFAAGIGLASAAVSFTIGLYYNTMVAWTLMYTWSSIEARLQKSPLPFTVCPSGEEYFYNETRLLEATTSDNLTAGESGPQEECRSVGSFQYYWFRKTLDISRDVDDFNSFNWSIALCLILAWLISYVCLVKGLSSSKRVVYVSSTLPYVILIIFFFKAMSLEGMSDGIYYFIAPDVSGLSSIQSACCLDPSLENHPTNSRNSGPNYLILMSGCKPLHRSSSHSDWALVD